MNFLSVCRQLGLLLIVISGAVLTVAAWACAQSLLGDGTEQTAFRALIMTVAIGGLLGSALWFGARRAAGPIGRREAILLVTLSWFVAAGLAGLPFRLWVALGHQTTAASPFGSYVNCYFEAMSGLTTTGATVLTDVGPLPRSILLWRAMTQWLGGFGIVVIFVAVLPLLGVGGKHLFRIEASGPSVEGVTPRIQETARVLLGVYSCITVMEIVALRLAGMGLFDAVCHTFATLATGGFSTRNSSMGGYHSATIDVVVIVFMVAAGINFGLYYQALRRGWRTALGNPELRCYLILVAVGSAVVVASIYGRTVTTTTGETSVAGFGQAVRYGVFQVVAIQTTTGFCTADFDQWSFVAKATLVMLMFIGGSAGSTAGGIKSIRFLIAVKIMWAELEHVFRPMAVRPVQTGRVGIDADLKLTTMTFILGAVLVTVLAAAMLMVFERGSSLDVTTAVTAVVASFTNTGPGLNRVGAVCNYGWFGDASKCVLTVVMALGRLELFTIAVLFFPRFWRSD